MPETIFLNILLLVGFVLICVLGGTLLDIREEEHEGDLEGSYEELEKHVQGEQRRVMEDGF